ncbi:conserved hypothetical protein [Pirellula staleyi DSM 6068]|uniref:Uncharacterized protein n=1 Tax=Pirellula staleyi (strain ATCC 27377 / DSM 6068 / ICPB 4128) TaxID=530564 RepID=D2R2Z8_PIRSD|nr:lipoprotein [Pirellula staleyi]ADB18731.1 conserved hypothetical protein [Pirellula staleyi DSM 6068]
MKLNLHRYLLIASTLLILSGCGQKSDSNQPNGIKDAIDARPNEELRDAAEDAGDAVKEAGQDMKEAIQGS